MEEYKAKWGHCCVTQDKAEKWEGLNVWAMRQRVLYNKKKMSNYKKEKLNNMSFVWNVLYNQWYNKYSIAYEYVNKYNKKIIKGTKYKGVDLGRWCFSNKHRYRQGKLDENRIELLKKIYDLDFDRTSLRRINNKDKNNVNKAFDNNIDLISKCLLYGIKITRNTIIDGVPIGSRIREYKKRYKKGKLPEERYQQLLCLGIDLAKEGSLM